ncbi:MAG: DNA polymerase III subunit delta' [Nitrospiraceae bacterium]|nr:DNA polymerase III subunit delta' [Nitrospiraceae bacterium]
MALKDVIGQEGAIKILKSAVLNRRAASAYLFQGPSGIGKRLAAVNFAKALNCQKSPDDGDACDSCPVCRRIEEGIYPDVREVRPEKGAIKIDEIRDLEEKLSLSAYEGKFKVAIVDEAHLMNKQASNAFLKCLEEPPSDSVIILVSSNPDRLLDTIKSRCQAVVFKPLSARDMSLLLKDRIKEPDMLQTLISLSMGRPGLVLEGKAGGSGILKKRQDFLKSLQDMLISKPGKSPSWADKEEIEEFMDGLEIFLRDMLVMRTTGRENLAMLGPDIPEGLKTFFKTAKEEVIIDCYQGVATLRESLVYNPNKSILWNYTAGMLKKLLPPSKKA